MIRWMETGNTPTILCRMATGLIFLSEGIQKYIFPELYGVGRFAKIGFAYPSFLAQYTASFEIICSILILAGLYTRLAAIPLVVIMAVAFVTTKWPLLLEKGFWP